MNNIIEWLTKTFHIDNNTSATIITSITVFLLGGLVAGFYRWLRAFRNKYSTRLVVLDTINSLRSQLTKAKNACNTSAPKFQLSDEMDFTYQDYTISQTQILRDIGFQTIDKAFRYRYNLRKTSKTRYELIDELWNIAVSLDQYRLLQQQKMSTFDIVFNTNNEKLKSSTTEYLDYMYAILGEPLQKDSVIFYYTDRLGKMHDNWQKSHKTQYPHYFEKLIVNPTVEVNNEFMNKGINPVLFQSIKLLSNFKFDLDNKRSILKSFQDVFTVSAEYFDSQEAKLSSIESDLRPALYFNSNPVFLGIIVITGLGLLGYLCVVTNLF